MIREIIINEIKDAIGHIPTTTEYESALDYLGDTINPACTFTDVSILLLDWRDDYLVKCDECGDWFLPEELETRAVPWDCFTEILVCSDNCFNDYCEYRKPQQPEISSHI